MKTKKIILCSITGFLIFSLGFVFRTFIRVNIIEPAAFVLWAIWRALESVNQNFYWQILIWGSVFLLIRFLPSKKVSQTAYPHKTNNKEIGGSLYWHHLLDEAQFSPEKRDILRFELENMLINTFVVKEQSSKAEVQTKFRKKQYAFPAFIYQYFFSVNNWKTILHKRIIKIGSCLPKKLQEPFAKPFLRKTRQIITWIQTQMESGYENSTLE